MKTKARNWLTLGLLLCLSHPLPAAEMSREDINPALIYWQAFAVMPDLGPEDQKHLLETQWRTQPMDQRAGDLTSRYDQSFKLLRAAVVTKAPCDWGVDMSLGPEALLPHLAKAKRCATIAVLRARWAVQQGRPEAALDDLTAAFVLGRNVSRDGTLISALVQIAIERIVLSYVVQQWPELSTETIGSFLSAIDSAPVRGTMAVSMETERTALYGWLLRNIQDLQQRYPGNDAKALEEATKLLDGMVSEDEGKPRSGYGTTVIQAAGGTMAGLLVYVRELEPLYREIEQAMSLPYTEFQPSIEQLQKRINTHANLIARECLPAVVKVRDKEFRVLAWLAMVRSAYQIRLDPAHGLEQTPDPFGNGPFEYSRFLLDGVDRGFKLKSQVRSPDFPEVLIFAEKPGTAFLVDGPKAGQKVQ
jgi:hypothetical protein